MPLKIWAPETHTTPLKAGVIIIEKDRVTSGLDLIIYNKRLQLKVLTLWI